MDHIQHEPRGEYLDFEIDGWRYRVSHGDPETAWEIGIELMKIVAEPAVSIATVGGDQDKGMDIIPAAMNRIMTKIDAKGTLQLMKRILATVEVLGKSGESDKKVSLASQAGFNLHFRGHPGRIFKVAIKGLEFTHQDFFTAIADVFANLMKAAGTKEAA